jgi:hypothetical protein
MVSPGAITYADDVNDIADATTGKPLVRLVQAVAQSIPDNSFTALTFTTEEIDTHGFHDTGSNTQRITPTVAGYYRFSGTYFSATITTPVLMAVKLRKNGTTDIAPGARGPGSASNPSMACTAIASCNGTTDYVEVMALQDSAGATNTVVASHATSVFECEFLRPL